jgi:chromosome segregation ATPase
MPSRTLEDKVEDLTKLAATLTEQVGNLQKEIKSISIDGAALGRGMADLRTNVALLERQSAEWKFIKDQLEILAALKITIALIEQNVEELKKTKEEWSRRVWALAGPILGAVVGVLLGYFLRR